MDLLEVTMDQDVSVMVPVEITGEAEGVKIGGILEMKRRELEVISLPDRIPDSIVVDISALQIGDVVHVADITPPDGVQIPYEANFTILSVVAPAAEPEPEEVEEEVAEEEVAEKEKAAEEEEEEVSEE
jgi:large subunit ribosomal protein L25